MLRLRLAQAFNALARPSEALDVLSQQDASGLAAEMHFQRGRALDALGQGHAALDEFRKALDADPRHRRACMKACRALREVGRMSDLLALCEDLAQQGVDHAQLLLDWGRALAIAGADGRARMLLFDPQLVTRTQLALPEGFNAAFAEELLGNPNWISEFPSDEEANRGSSRLHHLLAGRRPDLVRTLLGAIQGAVDARVVAMDGATGPWANARPRSAHLHAWGLLQRDGDYEAWHTHRGGWLSGVYYVRVPRAVLEAKDGRGALEFGPPPYLARTRPGLVETRQYVPAEGVLLLAPSHYHHRTLPSGLNEHRISFAFDVVPDA